MPEVSSTLTLKDGPRPVTIGFDDLRLSSEGDGVFALTDLPPNVAELYQKRVRIIGYATPQNSEPQMSLFTLRRERQID